MKVVYSEHFQAELCCVTGRYSAEDKELGRRFVQTVENTCLEITADPLRCRVLGGTRPPLLGSPLSIHHLLSR